MSKQTLAAGSLILCVAAGLFIICVLLIYTVENDSGHTGLDFYLALAVFVPVNLTGLIYLAVVRSPGHHRWLSLMI